MKRFFRKQEPAEGQTGQTTAPRGTILVVDDSPTETRIFVTALVRAGYRVETASDGEQGVEQARRLLPDLILMDVIMPVLNGFQATRMLHRDEATAHIPVIMVTTKDQPTDRTWGLRQGASDYLVKPVDPVALVERVNAVLGA
jgi:twitching motility two-component system response regulator PilH